MTDMQAQPQARDRTLVAATLDALIPGKPQQGLRGAGRPEVVEYVESKLAATPDVAALVDLGFAALREASQTQHDRAFADLGPEARETLMREVEQAQPFFLPILLMHVYTGYYQQPDVLDAIGYPARPPFPQGYDVDIDDRDLLAKLRAR